MNKIIAILFIGFITFYKNAISPHIGRACRYQPTCSTYGIQAIKKYGPFKGLWLTIKRLSTCHPWGGSGFDPVQ